ncbi:MAG: hypothetical protein KAT06_07195 [Gammaproteobacteria bacterium]|nr:hypothetical protein [Gammaproteobacteria bacterium]
MNESQMNEPPICETREKYLIGPISWKLFNQINYLLASDKEKEDFVDVMLHPKGYLCIRRAVQETVFGFEFRVHIDDIQLPIKLIEASTKQNMSSIVIAVKENKNVVQITQFVHEKKPDTDLGYSSGSSDGIGIQMKDITKAKEVKNLLNTLINKLVNNPTLVYALLPFYWQD